MRRLRTTAAVLEASDDSLVRWAAQALSSGGAAWEHNGAVAVHAPHLARRRRLVLAGPAEGVASLLAAHGRGVELRPLMERPLALEVAEVMPSPWVEDTPFGWMDRSGTLDRPAEACWLASPDDVETLLRVANPASWAWPGEEGVRRWAGVHVDSTLVATAAEAWSSADVGFIMGVAVHPSHTGKGLGRRVCQFVASNLLSRYGTCALFVDEDNAPAIALYRGLGFTYRDVTTLLPAG
ncbi:Acetyltransferase (GNAT) family protein [Lentzea xinjiangensis]|uniref:Acetyltransferase (GNAT) family protein n=1 Tax=Lentzea xinjiangensis TaxID=402600 RepID=A0A1H9E8N6_9PSEU|nr:GNAT family N-acetyltransferase [Lentzea xinjiangensis]SEQ22124.1 Acetyltransferase (GNAT) family protein [Lentzea xinjiangensis]